jgi:hypothetical protein
VRIKKSAKGMGWMAITAQAVANVFIIRDTFSSSVISVRSSIAMMSF